MEMCGKLWKCKVNDSLAFTRSAEQVVQSLYEQWGGN